MSSRVFKRVSARSPTETMPMPVNTDRTIICSILAFSMASMGLVGKISMMTFIRGGACLAAAFTPSPGRLSPAPGWKIIPSIMPRQMAKAVVPRYMITVLAPIRPIFLMSPSPATPSTREENTRGTMIILIMFIKMAPKGAIQVVAKGSPLCPSPRPAATPKIRPAKIFVVSPIQIHPFPTE